MIASLKFSLQHPEHNIRGAGHHGKLCLDGLPVFFATCLHRSNILLIHPQTNEPYSAGLSPPPGGAGVVYE